MKKSDIFTNPPYIQGRIDPDILPLVVALNSIAGIRTFESCSGHDKDEAYVCLVVDGVRTLRRLAGILQFADLTEEGSNTELPYCDLGVIWQGSIGNNIQHWPIGCIPLWLRIGDCVLSAELNPPTAEELAVFTEEFKESAGIESGEETMSEL